MESCNKAKESSVAMDKHNHVEMPTQKSSSRDKGGWNAAIFIIFVEIAERFAYHGVVGNLIMYLTNVLDQPIATAAKTVNIWMGVSSIFPLLGGFIADSYLGRFKTIVISTIIFLLGTILLTLSVSSVVPLNHRKIIFFYALYLLAIGEGGHKPCVQTFAADQFDEELPKEKQAKSQFFNWWYLGVVFGALLAVVVAIYVQDSISWTIGFGMLAVVVAAALGVFLIGIPKYRLQSPIGSPFTLMAQVFVASARKWHVKGTTGGWSVCFDDGADNKGVQNLVRTDQFRFLDKAAMIDDIDTSSQNRDHWRLCSINQVEEVKLVLRLFPIWFNCMIFAIIVAQQSTFYTKQGGTMEKTIGSHFKIPPASLNVFAALTIIFTVLIYDRVFVPFARRFTKHPSGITMLQRMGVGIFFSSLTMVVAATVEAKRVRIARDYGFERAPKSVLPMSIFWLIPQYMLNGLSDAFTIVGMQELFYDQVPVKMRSMGAAAFISTIGIGSFMSSAVIAMVQAISSRCGSKWLGDNINMAHLDYFYWVLVILSALNFCLYVWFAKGFVYKQVELDDASKQVQLVEA